MTTRQPVIAAVALTAAALLLGPGCADKRDRTPLTLVVMDPLARELACPCVGGYAQRDYPALAEHLGRQLHRPVSVCFADTLEKGIRQARATPSLVVGKESLVTADASFCGLSVRPLCRLTDRDGLTTLTGFFVVQTGDPAKAIADLRGRRILFGPQDSQEKHAAALAALVENGVPIPDELETRGGCSDSAQEVQDSPGTPAPVAVISSYAYPLLEGCGQIERGSLRILAQTRPVPFVTVFGTEAINPETAAQVREALLSVRADTDLLKRMESRDGFVPWVGSEWPDWRGSGRDGHTASLPESLQPPLKVLWRTPAGAHGMAGLAATGDVVIVAERDPSDQEDVFRCLRAADGRVLWTLHYPATGKLDYGRSPRATPVIRQDKIYLLGAFGDLHCVRLADGDIVWKRHLVTDLGGNVPTWGFSSTPLIVDDLLIVNPGGPETSLVALNCKSGEVVWKTAGNGAAYASFIAGTFGGRFQIVGYDAGSLGGWDPRTGQRLWRLAPPANGDFNVPTPVEIEGKLLVATENNGTRLYGFQKEGRINPSPLAENEDLSPETCSPTMARGRVFGVGTSLVALNVADNLKLQWVSEDACFNGHSSLIGDASHLLILTWHGELVLMDANSTEPRILSRTRLTDEDAEIYAHPALVGDRLFVRDATTIACYLLD